MTMRIALVAALLVVLASQQARAQVTPGQVWALFITTAEAAQAFAKIQPAPPPRPMPRPVVHVPPRFEVLTLVDPDSRRF